MDVPQVPCPVVDGLASLRNAFGDAHGKGLRHVKASKRHAELVVNLSGTICSFLISTHEAKNAANNRLHKDRSKTRGL
jgi:hypothetical protein